MKHLGIIKESKDITNKEYVDNKDAELDRKKLEESDLNELSNSRVLELWNQYIGEGEGEGGEGTNEGSSINMGVENAGKLLYVGSDGSITVLGLGKGLAIQDGVLYVVDISTAVVNSATLDESVLA